MSGRLLLFASSLLFTIVVSVSPAFAISISCSSGSGGESVSSSEIFDLDDRTALQESISLETGSIFKSRQAEGVGNNSIDESVAVTDYSLKNNIQSSGSFSASTSASATSELGALSQDVAGVGSLSVSLSGSEGSREASQEASVSYGALDSMQVIAAGEGVTASQSTGMVGLGGSILSGAVGDENVMGATGTFSGAGLLSVNLASSASAETGRASASGTATLDGFTFLDDAYFQAVSTQNLVGGMAGVRDMGDGRLGSLDLKVLNLEKAAMNSAALTTQSASQTTDGSSASYVLTRYKWIQNNPQIQLYLNPTNAPSGITMAASQTAIAAAANTWDIPVTQNIFADGTTVKIDTKKKVDSPFTSAPVSDKYSVHGWASLGNYLGMCRWWSNGQVKNGYYSITEADTWYNKNKKWTTVLRAAKGTTYDLQSVAVHELGHSIGLGDLYTLSSSDPRKSDFAQVMNAYDGAQRALGNGDRTGAKKLYG